MSSHRYVTMSTAFVTILPDKNPRDLLHINAYMYAKSRALYIYLFIYGPICLVRPYGRHAKGNVRDDNVAAVGYYDMVLTGLCRFRSLAAVFPDTASTLNSTITGN